MFRPTPLDTSPNQPFGSDALKRQKFASELLQLVGTITDSLVIGIPGAWGSGKTTFFNGLHFLVQSRDPPPVLAVRFDAWEAESYEDPLVGLAIALEAACPSEGAGGTDAWHKVKRLRRTVSSYFRSVAVPAVGVVSGALTAAVTGSVEGGGIGGAVAAAAASRALADATSAAESTLAESLKRPFRQQLQDVVDALEPKPGQGCRVLFLIDELDRCRPDYAIRVLERIKHYFSVPNVVFVLAYDPKYLSSAARAVYGPLIDAELYFRRFIEIEIPLPEPNQSAVVEQFYNRLNFSGLTKHLGQDTSWIKDIVEGIAKEFSLTLRDCEQLMVRIRLCLAKHGTTSPDIQALIPIAIACRFASQGLDRSDLGSSFPRVFKEVARRLSSREETAHLSQLMRAATLVMELPVHILDEKTASVSLEGRELKFFRDWTRSKQTGRSLEHRLLDMIPVW